MLVDGPQGFRMPRQPVTAVPAGPIITPPPMTLVEPAPQEATAETTAESPTPVESTEEAEAKILPSEAQYAIWVGKSLRAAAFARTKEELNDVVAGFTPGERARLVVFERKAVKVSVSFE